MTFWVKWIIIFVQAYLLGSLSFSIIVSKGIYKKDIRTFGS
ncbi:MAG: glycerol-3-phosphate acyltransferase, partial [Oscillospiraceae bacterium]|nr:glycerol-3-phosphate acyltransferase [Oscillospiraceae bacterium]